MGKCLRLSPDCELSSAVVFSSEMAVMISIACRNYSRVAPAKRLLLSNPCLAALTNRHGLVVEKQTKSAPLASGPVQLFSSSSKALAGTTSTHEDHTKLWTIERGLSVVLVPLVPAAFIFPSPVMDYLLAFTFTLHAHWGLETIVVDYLRPRVVGPALAKAGLAFVYGLSAFTLGGLCYFNYSDVGIVNAIKLFWKL